MHYLEVAQGHTQANAFPYQKPITQKEKSAAGEHLKIQVHGSRSLCAGAVKRGGYRAGMLELRDARGAQDEGQAAAMWLHPGG